MGTNLKYTIALFVNTGLSIFFIVLLLASFFTIPEVNAPVITVAVLIMVPFSINLFFNRMVYSLAKANKENRLMPEWIISYRNFILILKLIAVVIIALMLFTAAFTFYSDVQTVAKPQRVIYTVLLCLMLFTSVTDIMNIIYYQKVKKLNKAAINNIIESIGAQDQSNF